MANNRTISIEDALRKNIILKKAQYFNDYSNYITLFQTIQGKQLPMLIIDNDKRLSNLKEVNNYQEICFENLEINKAKNFQHNLYINCDTDEYKEKIFRKIIEQLESTSDTTEIFYAIFISDADSYENNLLKTLVDKCKENKIGVVLEINNKLEAIEGVTTGEEANL